VGILQLMILALRAVVRSRIGRIAETVGNLVFWLGAAYIVTVFSTMQLLTRNGSLSGLQC